LREAYPDEWESVKREVRALVARGDIDELQAAVLSLGAKPADAPRRERRRRGEEALIREEVRRQMMAEALRQVSVSAATGVREGKVRFSQFSGRVAQGLFFERDLVRKPVPMGRFRRRWPLMRQKELLMPLVQPKGIYCFYSVELVDALGSLIDGRSCVEIAAGDGTLTRFLRDAGADVVATDDHSWSAVSFPDDVVQEDASTSLRTRSPAVVLCSWPPPGNSFEKDVFTTPSVELYVVIGARDRVGTGDWVAYETQTAFDWAEDPELSKLVLPPELNSGVYVFRRR
jgi:hypothetical protein